MIKDLRRLKKHNGEGFLFSLDGGASPVSRKHIDNGLKKALHNIGMTANEIVERGLTLHAWRHFCNTELQKGGLTIPMIQSVTGYKSTRSTEMYTHFEPLEFGKVAQIQAAFLRPRHC